MTGPDTKPCAGCGKPTTGMCWTDCGMSLCGAPLCGDCSHVDEKYGWRHEPKEQKPLFVGVDLSSQPDMTAATVVLSPEAIAALPEVQALIRQAVEAEREALTRIIPTETDALNAVHAEADRLGVSFISIGMYLRGINDCRKMAKEKAAAIRKRGEG